MKPSLFIACCLLPGFVPGCTTTTKGEGKADFARLSLGSFFDSTVYEMRGRRITMTESSDVSKTRKESRLLSDDEVITFWRELDSQNVSSWRPTYVFQTPDKRPSCSYLSWDLRIRRDGKDVQIRGCDAYPHDRDPRQMTEHKLSKRFDRVWQAFSHRLPD